MHPAALNPESPTTWRQKTGMPIKAGWYYAHFKTSPTNDIHPVKVFESKIAHLGVLVTRWESGVVRLNTYDWYGPVTTCYEG